MIKAGHGSITVLCTENFAKHEVHDHLAKLREHFTKLRAKVRKMNLREALLEFTGS